METLPETLRLLGYRVEQLRDAFEVRLPLWCSVRVTERKEGLILDPRFGLASRSGATWGTAFFFLLAWFLFPDGTCDGQRPAGLSCGSVATRLTRLDGEL